MAYFLTFKALHIIFMVSWFSALFFLGRVLIYHSEVLEKDEEKKLFVPFFLKSERNIIWIILIPSILLTATFGTIMMFLTRAHYQGWFHIKLSLIMAFLFYNGYLLRLRRHIRLERPHPKGVKLRLLNEVPFFFLVGIVFTVYHKNFFSGIWAVLVLLFTLTLIGLVVRLRKKNRISKEGLVVQSKIK